MDKQVDEMNHHEMLNLVEEYRLYIPRNKFPDWRPTRRIEGTIVGVNEYLTIIATDGVLAFFLTDDGMVFQGHIQHFDKQVKTLFATPPQRRVSPKKRRDRVAEALALLADRVI